MNHRYIVLLFVITTCLFNSCSSSLNNTSIKRYPSNDETFFSGNTSWYSGSFDPPARGHLAIVDEVLRKTDGPVYLTINHNTAKNFNASIRERIDMLSLAFANNPRVRILREPVEGRRTLVKELRSRHQKGVLLFVGEDVLEQNYEALGDLDGLTFVSFFRKGQESDFRPDGRSKVFFEHLDGNGSMSSTLVRDKIWKSEGLSAYLTPEIEKYIRDRNLYKKANYDQVQLFNDFFQKITENFPELDLTNASQFTYKETQSKGGQIDAMIRWMLREAHIPNFLHGLYIEQVERTMQLESLPISIRLGEKQTCKKLLLTIIN